MRSMNKMTLGGAIFGITSGSQGFCEDYASLRSYGDPRPETWPRMNWDKWWADEVEAAVTAKIERIFLVGSLAGLPEVKINCRRRAV